MFAGIDWATQTHAVCVVDDDGARLTAFSAAHSAEGLDDLVDRLARLGPPERLAVAIERPDGRLVDRLLEAGHPVVPVSPNAIKTWRESEVVSGAKSDPGDAEVIAEYLRLRFHKLQPLEPFSAETKALRALSRTRDDLVKQRVAASNQLEAALDAYWPGARRLFSKTTSAIGLAFLEAYPTPASAARLGVGRMAGFLRRNGYSGRQTPAQLVTRLRAAPAGAGPGAEVEARSAAMLAVVTVIRTLNDTIAGLDRRIEQALGQHPDGHVFTSLPRAGRVNAAQILAEWGDCRDAYTSAEAVAALAGITPVTKRSGKHESVTFRWACNKRFRRAVTTFADNSRRASPWAADVYERARKRGCDHAHAVRILARAWIRVIFRCWLDGEAYDPARHGTKQEPAPSAPLAA